MGLLGEWHSQMDVKNAAMVLLQINDVRFLKNCQKYFAECFAQGFDAGGEYIQARWQSLRVNRDQWGNLTPAIVEALEDARKNLIKAGGIE